MIHEALGALIHHEHSRQAKTRQDATSPSPQSGEHLLVEQKASSERAVSRRIEGPFAELRLVALSSKEKRKESARTESLTAIRTVPASANIAVLALARPPTQ